MQTRLSPAQQVEVAEAYRAGVSVKEIAERFKISRHTVNEIRKREGVEARPQLALSPAQVQTATKLYEEGQSLATVGRQFGVDAGTVRNALIKAGVATRPRVGRE